MTAETAETAVWAVAVAVTVATKTKGAKARTTTNTTADCAGSMVPTVSTR